MTSHLYSLRSALDVGLDDLTGPVPPIEAVLFDFANTLFRMVPMDEWLSQVWRAAGRDPVELPVAQLREQLAEAAVLPDVVAAQVDRDVSVEAHRIATIAWFREVEALRGIEEVAYNQVLAPEAWRPFPDVEPVLRELAARGIPMGLVSDIVWDVRGNFAAHGMSGLISSYVLSYQEGREKPDPELFFKACKELGVDPRRTLMVGDNAPRDGGAVTAGLRVFLFPSEPRTGPRGLDAVLRMVG